MLTSSPFRIRVPVTPLMVFFNTHALVGLDSER